MKKGVRVKLRVHRSGVSHSYVITIPKAIIEGVLGWRPGDMLCVEVANREGELVVMIRRLEKVK